MKKRSPAKGGMSNKFTGGLQRSYRTLDGVLKSLLFAQPMNLLKQSMKARGQRLMRHR